MPHPQLNNRRVLLAITGGVAAYKSNEIARRLRENGAEVRVVLTETATRFVSKLTLQAVTGNEVRQSLFDPRAEAAMSHIELARWADVILIAPASANFIARLAAGFGDDLLSVLCLACDAPLALAPAMNQAMWRKASTRENCKCIEASGAHFFGPAEGLQACGDEGPGRMLEPDEIVARLAALFSSRVLDGRHVVITAGPTREYFDAVRYISNRSSGKMGFALARAAAEAGARVTLISGPVALKTPERVQRIDVVSADEMFEHCMAVAPGSDLFIGVAAVADFRPQLANRAKLPKHEMPEDIKLIANPDIVAAVAGLPKPQRPMTMGFAAQIENCEDYARAKLRAKNLDWIAANDVGQSEIGFDSDENELTLYSRKQRLLLSRASKLRLAQQIIAHIAKSLVPSSAGI